jgi:hypothetical protein
MVTLIGDCSQWMPLLENWIQSIKTLGASALKFFKDLTTALYSALRGAKKCTALTKVTENPATLVGDKC